MTARNVHWLFAQDCLEVDSKLIGESRLFVDDGDQVEWSQALVVSGLSGSAFDEHFLDWSELFEFGDLFDGVMQRRFTAVVLMINIFHPGQEIVYGFLASLIASPVQRSLARVIWGVHAQAIFVEISSWMGLIALGCKVHRTQAKLIDDVYLASIPNQDFNDIHISTVRRVMNRIKSIFTQSWTVYPSSTILVDDFSVLLSDFRAGVGFFVQESHGAFPITCDYVLQHKLQTKMRALMNQIPALVFLVIIQRQPHRFFGSQFLEKVLKSTKISIINKVEYLDLLLLLLF